MQLKKVYTLEEWINDQYSGSKSAYAFDMRISRQQVSQRLDHIVIDGVRYSKREEKGLKK